MAGTKKNRLGGIGMSARMNGCIFTAVALFALSAIAPNVFALGVKELETEKSAVTFAREVERGGYGIVSTEELKKWVDYALENSCIIFFDAAYEAFIRDPEIPHTIYEIEGAKKVAIEFRSFSKTAGFTGTRCAYIVIPDELVAFDSQGNAHQIRKLWMRRHTTKFNGVSYPVQKAAAAVYSGQGKKEVQEVIDYYMENARIMKESLGQAGYEVFGGENAPYIWVKTKNGMKSWDFFDKLLKEVNVVGTPGSGFGPSGEGYFRFSAFADRGNVLEAMERISRLQV